MVTNNAYTNRTIISTNRIGDGGVYGGLETGATDSVSVNWDWAFDPSPSLAVQSDGSLSGLAAVKGGGHGLNGHSIRLAPVSYTVQYWDQAAESLALETRTTGLPTALSYITNTTGEAALLWGKPGERVVAATFEASDYTVVTGAGAHPSVTVAVDPWLDPCLCELEPLGEPAVNPAAAVALWEHNSSSPSASSPKKVKVGVVIEFHALGGFDPGITVPSDWVNKPVPPSTVETEYVWDSGGGEDITAERYNPVPETIRVYRFTEPGDTRVSVTFAGEARQTYRYPLKKRRPTPLDTCGYPAGPCPLASATKHEETTLIAEDEDEAEFPLRVFTLELEARRKGAHSSVVAAGGLGSDVHIAEYVAKLDPPDDDPGFSMDFAVKLTGFDPQFPPAPGIPNGWLTDSPPFTGTVVATTAGKPHELHSSLKIGSSATLAGTDPYVNASAAASFAWDEVSWTGGAFNPCEWEDVSLTLTLEGEGVDGHSFAVKPKQVSAYFWIPASGADGGHWSLVQLSESETEALGHIFTAFRGPGDHEGAPEYDPDGGGQILPGAPAYLGATDLNGELPFQQICYANTVYVTQSVTLEGTDTLVYE